MDFGYKQELPLDLTKTNLLTIMDPSNKNIETYIYIYKISIF